MSFKKNMTVRLKSGGDLLVVERIDEEEATALCRRFSNGGADGALELFPLDSLREDVVRAHKSANSLSDTSLLRGLMCAGGLHRWELKTFRDHAHLGDIAADFCSHCGMIRMRG